MPNWASNTLVVEGLPEECERFALTHHAVPRGWKDDGVNDTSLNTKKKILEFSASVWDEDNKKHPYSQHGYNWQIEHWGTKWGACETYPDNIEDILDNAKEGVLYYNFDTAWSPPIAWLEKASKMFAVLTFTLRATEESDAYLYGADLIGANLSGANLNGAYLEGADLRDANLTGAMLRGHNLDDLKSSGAIID